MLDVLDEMEASAQPLPSQDAPTETSHKRWSARRTLIFIIVVCSLMWGAIILGVYGILNLIAPM